MFEAQLNRSLAQALSRSPRALELCATLTGRRLRVELSGFEISILLIVSASALQISTTSAAAADVTVSGTPLALLALASSNASHSVAVGGASISGDEQLAPQFQELARLLRPDLESMMGALVGRIPAHLATRAFSSLGAWGRAARDSLLRNTGEYLAHESRDLVPRAEAESFLGGVEALRAQLQRAEARAAQLTAQLEQLAAAPGAPPSGTV